MPHVIGIGIENHRVSLDGHVRSTRLHGHGIEELAVLFENNAETARVGNLEHGCVFFIAHEGYTQCVTPRGEIAESEIPFGIGGTTSYLLPLLGK